MKTYTELLTIRGETDGTSSTGTISLDSDIFQATANHLRLPKGSKAKIWFKKLSGEGETLIKLEYTYDVTVATPTWKTMQVEKLASKGELSIEKQRPSIMRAYKGTEAFRLTWEQPTAVKAYVEIGCELTDE